MLTPEARHSIEQSVLCWLATSNSSGQPSVSPKEIFAPHGDDALLIANIASPGSMKNIRGNPRVCVSVLDIFTQRGNQIFGTAEIITKSDSRFGGYSEPLIALAGPDYPFSSLFHITVNSCKEIVAPRYKLFPDTTEQEQIESAMHTYGVRPNTTATN
ncbi:MAG: pyridoxamine 5'-phosphate oxidase family protein [Phycisphaera sp.]|nr:MAG: pyridoxamine 5'-phosphate oxidase family protein [Phycisphaera sp.]